MAPTSLLLTLAVIYLLAFIQYWVERPAMSPNARRHNGIVAGLALVTAIVILVGIAFASSQRNEGAYRLGSWSFLVLTVPIVQMCALGFRITRILHHRQSPSR